jgi:hypothetical protein
MGWALTDAHLLDTIVLQDAVASLAGPFGELVCIEQRLDTLAAGLLFAAHAYAHADHSVLDSIIGGLAHLAGGIGLAALGDFPDARRQLSASLPGFTDLLASLTRALDGPLAAALPDGHPVLHDLGPDFDPAAAMAPRSFADLINELAWRDAGHHGAVSVSFVVGTDGHRRAIVDIPGTKSWNPVPNHDVTNVDTDIRALAGADTTYEEGVFAAMSAAGVEPHDDVMLVGHSEGGIVAVDAARDAVRSGRFRVTHVLTAGAPVGVVARGLPDTVQLLALENSADLIPHCDGAVNPDRPNITTVTATEQRYSIGADHDLEQSYEPVARAADRSRNASITSFTDSADEYLDGSALRTHAYWITRGF